MLFRWCTLSLYNIIYSDRFVKIIMTLALSKILAIREAQSTSDPAHSHALNSTNMKSLQPCGPFSSSSGSSMSRWLYSTLGKNVSRKHVWIEASITRRIITNVLRQIESKITLMHPRRLELFLPWWCSLLSAFGCFWSSIRSSLSKNDYVVEQSEDNVVDGYITSLGDITLCLDDQWRLQKIANIINLLSTF